MKSTKQAKARGHTQIRCGSEVFVFRYDLDLASLKTLGRTLAMMVMAPDNQFNVIAAYRVMKHIDWLLDELEREGTNP